MKKMYLAVEENGQEVIFSSEPERDNIDGIWVESGVIKNGGSFELLKGSIKKLIGKELTWEDEPVELEEGVLELKTDILYIYHVHATANTSTTKNSTYDGIFELTKEVDNIEQYRKVKDHIADLNKEFIRNSIAITSLTLLKKKVL